MKSLIAILALIMVSQANAQNNYGAQQGAQPLPVARQAPKAVMYDERTNELVEVQPQVQPQAQPQQPQVQVQTQAEAAQSAPIYILNNQRLQGYQGAQAQIQEQPASLVQDAPLKNSAAESMRKQRHGAEDATEDGIVQALEKARLDDEVRRRERFNSAIAPVESSAPPAAPQYAPVQPVQTQQVVPVVIAAPQAKIETPAVEKEEKEEKVDIKSEIRAALQENESAKKPAQTRNYISALAGQGAYPDVINVKGNGAVGVALGLVTPEGVVAEGSFLYGSYDLENLFTAYTRITTMKQFNFAGALKYQLLSGRIRPSLGGVAGYTRRSYSEDQATDFLTSDALDAGVVGGVDISLTDSLSIGLDMRYLWNISYKQNSQNTRSFVYQGGANPVEALQYYTAALAAKFTF